jgi:hypothetical protein
MTKTNKSMLLDRIKRETEKDTEKEMKHITYILNF